MKQYISKSVLAAEIERLIKSYSPIWSSEGKYRVEAYKEILDFINSNCLEINRSGNSHIGENGDLEKAAASYAREQLRNPDYPTYNDEYEIECAFKAGAQWQKEQKVLNDNNKEYHRVPSTTLKRLYMNEAKYELLKSDIIEGIVGDFEKGTTHNYLTIKIPMLLCPSNCAKGDKVKLIIIKEE